jgi:hypothetical protein
MLTRSCRVGIATKVTGWPLNLNPSQPPLPPLPQLPDLRRRQPGDLADIAIAHAVFGHLKDYLCVTLLDALLVRLVCPDVQSGLSLARKLNF